MRRALLSVSDKSGLVDFARALIERHWELISTGGTAKALRDAGLTVLDISDVTGFPEMLDGRVKTLHPIVHGGLLFRRDLPEHVDAVAAHDIRPIDLVVVNLYPFRQTAARAGVLPHDVIEQIDIGGPSMLRSAAKNFGAVTVVCDPADYGRVITSLDARDDEGGMILRRDLAAKVFAHTASYDSAIAGWLQHQVAPDDPFPATLPLAFEHAQHLRYGENPEQRAAFYVERAGAGLASLKQLGGKELSFNNLLDVDGALMAIEPFAKQVACAIIKHTTPCGLAIGATPLEAWQKALACDPTSAFGGVVAFSTGIDDATAEAMSSLFLECIVAPSIADSAADLLGRKKNLRVLIGTLPAGDAGGMDVKRVRGGVLLQDRMQVPTGSIPWKVVTKRAPSEAELVDLAFAWRASAAVKSNAIVLAKGGATIGIGAGQMSRVDASYLAGHKAKLAGHDTVGAALASDAFFPFRDGVDHAATAGVTAIVQPGGSVRDAEVIAAADEHGIAMVFTGARLFRH
ncbi:MAG TPA: bifunctional phosphoribosylaminoimidazolecarboxamide formyltransferase/IMP cyclohydrolase [Gemmatimonadaceae bacterium]|nr:bifunctional phosphoribosylaminoimidazolecarboxamide formyltransferase/IMP cyclohydrolase [Gemmatimonadaceae bacterium]